MQCYPWKIKRLEPAGIGNKYIGWVSDINRQGLASRNVLAGIKSVKEGYYKLTVKIGVLQKLYCRNLRIIMFF